jgi:MEMO1 family protein
MRTRPAFLAGTWYPKEPSHLEQLLGTFFERASPPIPGIRGIVVPHAGYVYSGAIAAKAYSAIPAGFDGTIVLIGPSHRSPVTATSVCSWESPVGMVNPDETFIRAMGVKVDEGLFFQERNPENSLEVQIPFIKYRFPRARIAPILMGEQSLMSAITLSERILEAASVTVRDIRMVASSDFSHYVSAAMARSADLQVIRELSNLNVPAFYEQIRKTGSTACGYGPIATMCLVAQEMGAKSGDLITYGTSGDITGDQSEVVGYAAIAVM